MEQSKIIDMLETYQWSSPLDPQRKEKKIKLFARESSQQVKEEREIFLGFLFNYYYKHGK